MKKIIIFLIISLFFIGCSQNERQVGEDEEPVIALPEKIEPVEEQIAVQPPEVPQPPQMSEQLQEVIDKSSKVTSLQYLYRSPKGEVITYYIKGDKIKATFSSMQMLDGFEYYHIYMDETAYLVCDRMTECKGLKAKEVDISEFVPISPLQIVQSIEFAEITEETQIDNKNTVVVTYTNTEGNIQKLWIWDFWGIPLKAEETIRGDVLVTKYDNLVPNIVKESDITMPENLEFE